MTACSWAIARWAGEEFPPYRTVGIRIETSARAAETGGDLIEFDVIGRQRGIIAVPHVHPEPWGRIWASVGS
jgi:hypothetical protein